MSAAPRGSCLALSPLGEGNVGIGGGVRFSGLARCARLNTVGGRNRPGAPR